MRKFTEELRFLRCQVQNLKMSRRIAAFLMLSPLKMEEVSQNSCVFDVVTFENGGSLAELLGFPVVTFENRGSLAEANNRLNMCQTFFVAVLLCLCSLLTAFLTWRRHSFQAIFPLSLLKNPAFSDDTKAGEDFSSRCLCAIVLSFLTRSHGQCMLRTQGAGKNVRVVHGRYRGRVMSHFWKLRNYTTNRF